MGQPDSPADAALQSLRMSCDRCRIHKLKCIATSSADGSPCCERCKRAKAQCVFGRRRRANRFSSNQTASSAQEAQPKPQPALMPSPPSTSASMSASTSVSDTGPRNADATIAPSSTEGHCSASTSSTDREAKSWESFMLGVRDELGTDLIVGASLESGLTTVDLVGVSGDKDWDWLNPDIGIREAQSSDVESWGITPQSPPAPSFTPASGTCPGSSTAVPSSATILSDSALVQKLLAVVAEMEWCLRTLELGQWLYDSTEGLDKYPIGNVLHLSHEFSATANLALGGVNARARAGLPFCSENRAQGTAATGMIHVPVSTDTGEAAFGVIDTTTSLLVLTGYKWLVRIYCAVLGHFKAYLSLTSCTRNARGPRGQAANLGANPSLQLGELAGASGCSDLGKIHMALDMLQRAVSDVEDPLGRGGTALRNLVVTSLTKETLLGPSDSNEEGDRLEGQFQLVKSLLREQMGL